MAQTATRFQQQCTAHPNLYYLVQVDGDPEFRLNAISARKGGAKAEFLPAGWVYQNKHEAEEVVNRWTQGKRKLRIVPWYEPRLDIIWNGKKNEVSLAKKSIKLELDNYRFNKKKELIESQCHASGLHPSWLNAKVMPDDMSEEDKKAHAYFKPLWDKTFEEQEHLDLQGQDIAREEEDLKEEQITSPALNTNVQSELKKLAISLLEKEEPCGNFTTKYLPKILREYIDSICCQSDAHPIMITTSTLSSISGIIKKRLKIPKGEYFQTLYANLWMISLYKSGGFKSTAMENGAHIARGISKEVINKIKTIEKELREGKNKKEELENKKLEESLKDVILPNKITSEALLEHLSQGHAGVILTGEFGAWLQNMEKSNNGDLKAIFTELYDVPPCYRYKTKNQGDHILEDPFFSICGVSTLAWLKENLKPNDVSSGFFARFLLFTPPHKDNIPAALPTDKQRVNPEAEKAVRDILNNMSDRYEYKLSQSAKIVFESAHLSLYSMTKTYSDKCQEILDPYLKRWSPYILKLAMIMQLFEDPHTNEISDTSINAAMSILLPAIKSTALLFEGELGESDQQKKTRLINEWICNRIKKDKPPTWAALITSGVLEGGAGMYEYPMKTLVEGGLVNEIQKPHKKDWLYVPVKKQVG